MVKQGSHGVFGVYASMVYEHITGFDHFVAHDLVLAASVQKLAFQLHGC